MKIGILTYHRTHNYGACLQALALRVALEQLGHKVFYVDYWPGYHQRKYAAFNIDEFRALGLRGKIRYTLNTIMFLPFFLKRKEHFESFHKKYILPFCKSTDDSFDAIIYGSDQIWRKQYHTSRYNPVYFGVNDFHTQRHISYAASMGILPSSKEDISTVISYVSHLDMIGVREIDLQEFLLRHGVPDVKLTIDPTLLLDSDVWDKIIPYDIYTGRPYILVYALWGEVFDMQSINQFAKEQKMIVKILRGKPTHSDTETEITTAGPETFLSLIKNARIVFSSSFHGLAFSIIYHKQFYTSFGKNGGRAKSLLDSIGLSDRYLEPMQYITEEMFDEKVDYSEADELLSRLKSSSSVFMRSI